MRLLQYMLRVMWNGHSCFRITDGITTVVTDPHDGESLNLPPPPKYADVVTVSHDHQDHNSGVKLYTCPVLTKPADRKVKTATLKGVHCWHDDQKGKRLGHNIVWNIIINGLQITHLGDLGHYLTASQMFQIGVPDILMINTGADIPLAEDNIALLSPKIIIPMHYYTAGINFPYYNLKTILDFLRNKQNVVQVENERVYTRDDIPYQPEVHVYEPPRKQR